VNGELNMQETLNEIEELQKYYVEFMKKIKKIEGKVSVEKRKYLSKLIPSSISVYIDCDEALFKEGFLRTNAVEFLRWCKTNFECYLLTSVTKNEFELACREIGAEDIYSEIKYIDLDLYKKRYEAVDLYDDFYYITTSKAPSSINEIMDSNGENRLIKMKKQPFDSIREKLRDIMTDRVISKIEELEVFYKAEFDLYKRGGYFGGRGGRGWSFKHKKSGKYELSIHYLNKRDFIVNWSLDEKDENDWVEKSEEMFSSNTYEEFILHLENLPNILVDIDKKLS